jgi:hypothetical protein
LLSAIYSLRIELALQYADTVSRWFFLLGVVIVGGCAPLLRVRRALSPESFVTPETATGNHADVVVESGWERDSRMTYQPDVAFERDGVRWIEPVIVTSRGYVDILPLRQDVEVRLYVRHLGVVVGPRDFVQLVTRSGTLSGELPTAIRFLPTSPLGHEPLRVELRDLNNVYSDDRVEDGDLVMIEVGPPGEVPDRYLFRSLRFGLHSRVVAGVLLRTPLPGVELPPDLELSPALVASLATRYRLRTQGPAATFFSERFAVMISVGIGNSVFEQREEGTRLHTVVDSVVMGGGIEGFRMFSLQVLGNVAAPFDDDLRPEWALAVGIDAVQLARFASHLDLRLLRENPMSEDRPR